MFIVWMGEEFGESKEKMVGEAKLQWNLIEDKKNEFNQQIFDYWYETTKKNSEFLPFYDGITLEIKQNERSILHIQRSLLSRTN